MRRYLGAATLALLTACGGGGGGGGDEGGQVTAGCDVPLAGQCATITTTQATWDRIGRGHRLGRAVRRRRLRPRRHRGARLPGRGPGWALHGGHLLGDGVGGDRVRLLLVDLHGRPGGRGLRRPRRDLHRRLRGAGAMACERKRPSLNQLMSTEADAGRTGSSFRSFNDAEALRRPSGIERQDRPELGGG